MSRKFNTKKFIKDVLNDRYALVIGNEIILDTKIEPTRHQRTATQSVVEVLLYPSSSDPLFLLRYSFGAVKEMVGSRYTPASCLSKSGSRHKNRQKYNYSMSGICEPGKCSIQRRIHGTLLEVRTSNGGLTNIWGVYALCNVCSSADEAGVMGLRAYVHRQIIMK